MVIHSAALMPYRKTLNLELSQPAIDDLRDIAQYTFTRYGERQMEDYLDVLEAGMELLSQNPEIGHSRFDLPEGYKCLTVEKHLLIFTIQSESIMVARILHQRLDLQRRLSGKEQTESTGD